MLAPTLFSFFRHTIASVRLAVVKTLHSFLSVPSLPKEWITPSFLRLVIQNLVFEERHDIRGATLDLWTVVLSVLKSGDGLLETTIGQQLVLDWYALAMTPLGVPVDPSLLYHPSLGANDTVPAEKHNVDKNMLMQDLALISVETVLRARVATAKAFAWVIAEWPLQGDSLDQLFRPMLDHYIQSPSMLQKFLAAVIVEEWATKYGSDPSRVGKDGEMLVRVCPLAADLAQKILKWLQSEPPVAYHEMALSLSRIYSDCVNLLQSFATDCKVPASSIPRLSPNIDIHAQGENPDTFSIGTAQTVVTQYFTQLKESLGRSKKKEVMALQERRSRISAAISAYNEVKTQHDIRVSAAFAAAFVALKEAPDKVSPIVKGIMNGIKVCITTSVSCDPGLIICFRAKRMLTYRGALLLQ
jgi:TATA-binding protein-associated factor